MISSSLRFIFIKFIAIIVVAVYASSFEQFVVLHNYSTFAQESTKKWQSVQERNKPLLKRQKEIEKFIDDVKSLPAEFAADLLIKLVESKVTLDKEWKIEIINDGFLLAASAQYQNRRQGLPGSIADTSSNLLSSALELNLDTLSLQCRAVRAMLAIDPKKARDLFSNISSFQTPTINCQDTFVYNVSDYYQVLGAVFEKGFSIEERKRNEHVNFLIGRIGYLKSPVQLSPAATMLSSLSVSSDELEIILPNFISSLSRISGDDTSYTVTVESVVKSVSQLALKCNERGVLNGGLLTSLRMYLVSNLSSERCATVNLKREESGYVKYFNEEVRFQVFPNGSVPSLSGEDLKPARLGKRPIYSLYWQTADSKKILQQIKHLRFGSGNVPLTDSNKESSEWKEELRHFLKNIENWRKSSNEAEADYFHQKSIVFLSLLDVSADLSTKSEILNNYISFLNNSSLMSESRVEWFLRATELIKLKRSLKGRSPTIDELLSVGIANNNVLALYEKFDNLSSSPK